jgi:hypothetical protein
MVLLNGVLRYSQESLPEISLRESDDVDMNDERGYVFTKGDILDVLEQYSIKISEEMLHIDDITFTDYGCWASVIWNEDLANFINSIALVRVFWDLCTTNRGPLLTSKFLKFAIETEKYNSMARGR